jgi:opacity protein-like surface antigen
VYGITPGISITLLPGLRIGGSATFLTGSSDDNEHRVERGHINIAIGDGKPQNFMVDTVYYVQSKVGTSTYTGSIFTLGLHFEQEHYSIGVTVKPPMALTRTWDGDVTNIDTTKKPFPVRIDSLTARRYHESGKDDLNFPLSYSLGIVLRPTDKWTIAFGYELRHLADVELTSSSNSTVSKPWVNNRGAMRLGAEYLASDLLALRGGYREDIQAFSPDGSAIIDEPARGGVYSIGAGIGVGHILIDLTYEYSLLKYQDIYQSNVNYNTRQQHQFMMEIAYRF